ncbi:unnamed protein product [Linum tenue]|uniref:Uncharacterized protein n=1 Tax=Linum tenue TaxID=586396 RepID=A0AAV0JD06_9ROSI|nr:unnamed protein product [Linum tenue]
MVMMAFGILINEFIYNADVTAYILLGFCFYALFVSQACRFPVQLGATSALLGSTAIMAWAPWKNDGERHPVEAGIITFVLILICILRHGLAGDPPHNNRNR